MTACRTVFDTSSEEKCTTSYKKECDMVYETADDYEYAQKCMTTYEEKCQGDGYSQLCKKVIQSSTDAITSISLSFFLLLKQSM